MTVLITSAAEPNASTTLASASTVNIGAAGVPYITISGTTTITAFDSVPAGTRRQLRFSGALTLTHNATSLILPFSSKDWVTVAGDLATFISEGSGNWRCVSYVRPGATPHSFPFTVISVDFNSANTDNAITVPLPPGMTRWLPSSLRISGASAINTTATFGVWSGAGATGTNFVASGTAGALSSTSENAAGNYQGCSLLGTSNCWNYTTIYFRVQTAQGSACTANVMFTIAALP